MRANKSRLSVSRLAAVAAGVVVVGAAQAHATLMLNVYEGATHLISVSDNDANDSDSTPNEIVYNSPGDASFTFSVDVAKSNNPGGSSDNLNITSFSARSTSSGVQNLTLVLSDLGFVPPPGIGNMTLQSTVSGAFTSATVGDNVSFQSFADGSNVQQTTMTPSGSPTESPVQKFTKSVNGLGVESFGASTTSTVISPAFTNPFSLSSVSTFNLSPDAEVQFNGASVVAVVAPEPASVGLLAIGSMGLLGARRRRI